MQYITLEVAKERSFMIAKSAYDKFIQEVPAWLKNRKNGIPDFPSIVWKKKGYKLAGTTRYEYGGVVIEMNINFLHSESAEEFIKYTMLHELAHAINYYYNGYHHDNQWKMIARLLGDDGNRCHNYKLPDNKPARKVYYLKCNDCLKVHEVTARKYNRYYRYVCGYCRGKLVPISVENEKSDIEKELQELFENEI